MKSDGPYIGHHYAINLQNLGPLVTVNGKLVTNVKSQMHVDTTAVQWHFHVVLFFVILNLNFNLTDAGAIF